MTLNTKKYYPHIDALKGVAIILMVIGHALAWSYNDIGFLTKNISGLTTNELYASFVWKIIYSFHMPLLICVSGYLFHKNTSYDSVFVKEQLKKRIIRLLVPYIATGMFVWFLKGYFGYWFLQILFLLNVIVVVENYTVQAFFSNKKYKWIVSHIVVFLGLFIFTKVISNLDLPKELNNLANIHNYYLAFILGTSLKQFPKLEEYLTSDKIKFIALLVFVAIFTLNLYGYFKILSIVGAAAIIINLWGVFKGCEFKYSFEKPIILIGKNSLEIYIFHLFFIISIKEVGDYLLSISDFATNITIQLIYSITNTIIAVLLSLVISKIIKKNKYLSKLIFGV